jgi:hypothetical protein
MNRFKTRKGLPSLSQMGLIRMPANPRQRPFGEGGTKTKGTVLVSFNEHTNEERQLHPTKGWRKLNVKRARAQALVSEILHGVGRPLTMQARFLTQGY